MTDPADAMPSELAKRSEGGVTGARGPAEIHPLARTPEEWRAVLAELGERPFRAQQVFRWLHVRGVFEPEKMTDLSADLRARLAELGVAAPAEVADVHRSADGTRKLVLEMAGGARVECVIIPMSARSDEVVDADAGAAPDDDDEPDSAEDEPKRRITLCISTQFGCAMGCMFCASGQRGLVRGLGAAEIVAQVLIAKRYLEPDEYLRNIVFMGMGEPLHHYEETARAIRLLTHPDGIGLGSRRITVSTVGLVPGIRRLGQDFAGKIGLAVSLHASDDATRERIMPLNKRYPLRELLAELRAYPLPRRRRITIEYTLIAGVNDEAKHARALVKLVAPLKVKVNLIPMNAIDASSLGAPNRERVEAFREILARAGLSCFVRVRRGDDVSAACGQLAFAGDLVRGPKRSR